MQIVDGCASVAPLAVTVSVTLGLNEAIKPEWKVYPNPTTDFVIVSGNQTVESVKVFSILGQVISDTIYNNSEVQLDLSGLPAAVYFVEVHSGNASQIYRIIRK